MSQMNNEIRSFVLDGLKNKLNLTELEKHIIDTCNELTKNPFDSFGAEKQIAKNYTKYPELRPAVNAMPYTVQKSVADITDTDRAYILNIQLNLLCAKKINGCN